MCGICGVVDWSGGVDAPAIVRRMVPTMRHRGPDDEGISNFEFRIADLLHHRDTENSEDAQKRISDFGLRNSDLETLHHRDTENSEDANSKLEIRNPKFAVGMRRLSIIDIEGGHQPVFNEDGQVGGVLNGEIYNFHELREQLEDRGHKFRTRSDSEMMVHAYEEWGEECVERFEGMFALAVFDRRSSEFRVSSSESREARSSEFRVSSFESQQSELSDQHSGRLFLARDRLGIKPLYYYARSAQLGISNFEYRIADLEKRHHRDTESAEDAQKRSSNFEFRNSDLASKGNSDAELTDEDNLQSRSTNLGSQHEIRISKSAIRNPTFLFASEVRTLLASGVVPRQLSKDAVESYLLFGSVGEPMTLIEGVLSIPPGHRLTIDLTEGNKPVRPEPYWNIAGSRQSFEFRVSSSEFENSGAATEDSEFRVSSSMSAKSKGQRAKGQERGAELQRNGGGSSKTTHANAAQQVRQLLGDSVRKHLIADVPVGVFLSSGIDSTALAALASRETAGIHTFTVAFPEKEFSEAEIARRTAATFGTTHQELMLSGDEMLARLSEAVAALDQPSMDGINTYFVSWGAANAGLKVTLSGLGGDEVFGGYSTFRRTTHFQRLAAIGDNMPRSVRTAAASAMSAAGGRFMSRDAARKLTGLLSSSETLPDAFFFGRAVFTPIQVAALLPRSGTNGALPPWRAWLAATVLQARELDPFAAVTCMEARSYLVNTLLRDTDSMSMAHSLEVRVPFLDHPLVEYVTHLPQAAKLQKGIPKALLVEAMGDLLPKDVVGQKKRGFTFPWSEWLRGPLKARVESSLSELSPALSEVLDAKETRRVWQDYLEGKTSWSRPWTLYVLNEWAKAHLK